MWAEKSSESVGWRMNLSMVRFQDGMDGVDLWEVAAAIRSVAAWLRDGHREGAVLDVNGNAVGHYELSE